MLRAHATNPAEAVEAAYARIQRERMDGVPVLNYALVVEAVDFQRWQGCWLGMVVTPWCMSALLLPAEAEGWSMPGENQRRFVKFPAGDFSFLGGAEEEIGDYLSCALISAMNQFRGQDAARMTARAALLAMHSAPGQAPQGSPAKGCSPSMSRRRFLALE